MNSPLLRMANLVMVSNLGSRLLMKEQLLTWRVDQRPMVNVFQQLHAATETTPHQGR